MKKLIYQSILTIFIFCNAFSAYSSTYQFPPGFKWCVATSAHQIEGGNTNSDWWEFEHLPKTIHGNDKSGAATNHWNMIKEDTKLISHLGANMYRFSIEWAKVEPEEGVFDQKVLDHYLEEVKELKRNNIEVMLTFHHFTHPKWFMKKNGWLSKDAPRLFTRYVREVYNYLGEHIKYFVTINEPMVFIVGGWSSGTFPPGVQDNKVTARVIIGVLKAHAAAYHGLKTLARSSKREIQVGFAHHLRVMDPYKWWNPLDQIMAYYLDELFNWSFLKALKSGTFKLYLPLSLDVEEKIENLQGSQDFLGVNYYSRDLIKFTTSNSAHFELIVKEGSPKNDLGWEIYPEGFYTVAKKAHNLFPNLDIYITENGLADSKDDKREKFINDHLFQVSRMIKDGMPVKGYCHWSLMDNFEWAEGFKPRFGLYEVDYSNFKRTLRPSGEKYKKIIKNHSITF